MSDDNKTTSESLWAPDLDFGDLNVEENNNNNTFDFGDENVVIDPETTLNYNYGVMETEPSEEPAATGIVIGSIVDYIRMDKHIYQPAVIVISISTVEGNSTYTLFDTDDRITYNKIPKSDITDTGKVIEIDPILKEFDLIAAPDYSKKPIEDGDVIDQDSGDVNAILIDGIEKTFDNLTINKSGDSQSQSETSNNAITVKNAGSLTLTNSNITTEANYTNGIVSIGRDSNVNVSNTNVTTTGDNSNALLALDYGTITANNCNLKVSGENSFAIKAKNYGEITVQGGTIEAKDSPIVVESNGKVTVSNVSIVPEENQNIIDITDGTIELSNVSITQPSFTTIEEVINFQPLYIHENIDGAGATVTFNGSTITTENTAFYVENADASITVNDSIINAKSILTTVDDNDSDDRTTDVTITFNNSTIEGTFDITPLNFLTINLNGGMFTGSIDNDHMEEEASISVVMDDNAHWKLTADCYINAFTPPTDVDNIDRNGFNIYINGERWIQHPPVIIDIDTGYDSNGVPTTRIMKVLKTEDLPPVTERKASYIYFVYDKMELYLYQSYYADPFCIVETLPDKDHIVENMLYITLEGKLYTYTSYTIKEIGHVEELVDGEGVYDPAQLEILRQAGTTYFMNAESRYLDPQTCTLQLPYKNGNYQLSLNLANDLVIDEDTIIKYNPNTNQFEIMGKEYQYPDELKNINKYKGFVTDTVSTYIDGYTFRSDVNISNSEGNGVEVRPDGLYVDVSLFASQERYEKLIVAFDQYKSIIDHYIIQLRDGIKEATGAVTGETISQMILDALENYKNDIDLMVEGYENLYNRIGIMEDEVDNFDVKLDLAEIDIKNFVNETNSAWSSFTNDNPYVPSEYTQDELTLKGSAMAEYRSSIIKIRTDNPGISYDYRTGLSETESEMMDRVVSSIVSKGQSLNGYSETYSTRWELPETGIVGITYYVIKHDNENPLFRIYTWNSEEYVLGTDLYPDSEDPKPTPPEPPVDPTPDDPVEPENPDNSDPNNTGDNTTTDPEPESPDETPSEEDTTPTDNIDTP